MIPSDKNLGATLTPDGVRFSVWSSAATKIWVCLFDGDGRETHRVPLARARDGVFSAHIPGLEEGQLYGLRADGPYEPQKGLCFDPDKLLVDPYAVEIDRPYRYDAHLGAPRGEAGDTAPLMPKAIVKRPLQPLQSTTIFRPGGLIYELQVRAFTMRHPDVPQHERGTVRALAHPAVIAHLKKIGVTAVELMPITAWMAERHLLPLGLTNAWGYNPVTFMALEPRLCPGGVAELRETVAALHEAGIGVILDLVFNHTGESDAHGPTLALRGLDEKAYYRRSGRRLINDSGTGNTVACDHPAVKRMVLDSLRHFVLAAGIDGFRFDLAPILGRNKYGFRRDAALLKAMRQDPVLRDRILIAEPWDIGPGGYQLGNFGAPWLEWNDVYRDDMRRFWRGDVGMIGGLATRMAGSSDIFHRDGEPATRTVNLIAAHDGFALADITAYEDRHNWANGEQNRDGHGNNLSWNNGVEGATKEADVLRDRQRDIRAMLATLFASRGAIMLTAGDEFGRTQGGNNNAYCQDNEVTWLDWQGRDLALEDFVERLATFRFGRGAALASTEFLSGHPSHGSHFNDIRWLSDNGRTMKESDWHDSERRRLAMVLGPPEAAGGRVAVLINGDPRAAAFTLPPRAGWQWRRVALDNEPQSVAEAFLLEGRSVAYVEEMQETP